MLQVLLRRQRLLWSWDVKQDRVWVFHDGCLMDGDCSICDPAWFPSVFKGCTMNDCYYVLTDKLNEEIGRIDSLPRVPVKGDQIRLADRLFYTVCAVAFDQLNPQKVTLVVE